MPQAIRANRPPYGWLEAEEKEINRKIILIVKISCSNSMNSDNKVLLPLSVSLYYFSPSWLLHKAKHCKMKQKSNVLTYLKWPRDSAGASM